MGGTQILSVFVYIYATSEHQNEICKTVGYLATKENCQQSMGFELNHILQNTFISVTGDVNQSW